MAMQSKNSDETHAGLVLTWDEAAERCAKRTHNNHLLMRRGVYKDELLGKVVIFGNSFNSIERREQEVDAIRAKLKEHGETVLGFGVYSSDGEFSGYSFAIIVDAAEDHAEAAEGYVDELEVLYIQPIIKK